MPVHDAAAEGFGRTADEYERSRPGYPSAVVDLLAQVLPVRPRSRVCDVGAGTGKLTRLLLGTGADVVAVEPVEAMRRKLVVLCPEATVLDGTAEDLPLGDQSVDVVTAAQAFHWFALPDALHEFARVLRPEGGLAMVWNVQDTSVAWVAAIEALVTAVPGARPYRHGVDNAALVADAGGFTPVQRRSYENRIEATPAAVLERVASTSFVAALADEGRAEVLERVRELLATHPDTAGRDRLAYPYRTDVLWCHRLP